MESGVLRRRFKHRPKRLSRRNEREKFDRLVMPAAFLCYPVAVAILMAGGLSHLVYGTFERRILGLGLAVLAIPVALFLYRVARGHFSEELDEP